jgi:hypothetical protein
LEINLFWPAPTEEAIHFPVFLTVNCVVAIEIKHSEDQVCHGTGCVSREILRVRQLPQVVSESFELSERDHIVSIAISFALHPIKESLHIHHDMLARTMDQLCHQYTKILGIQLWTC